MFWLLTLAFIAFLSYRFTVWIEGSPVWAWWSMMTCALSLGALAVIFWNTEFTEQLIPLDQVGIAAVLAIPINIFILMGPEMTAFIFAMAASYTLKKCFDGGWYRLAIQLQEFEEEKDRAENKKV